MAIAEPFDLPGKFYLIHADDMRAVMDWLEARSMNYFQWAPVGYDQGRILLLVDDAHGFRDERNTQLNIEFRLRWC